VSGENGGQMSKTFWQYADERYATNLDDAHRRFDYWMKKAEDQPVIVLKDGKRIGAIISDADYISLKRSEVQVISLRDMTPEEIEAIENEAPWT